VQQCTLKIYFEISMIVPFRRQLVVLDMNEKCICLGNRQHTQPQLQGKRIRSHVAPAAWANSKLVVHIHGMEVGPGDVVHIRLLQFALPSHHVTFVTRLHAAAHHQWRVLGRSRSAQQCHLPLVHVEGACKIDVLAADLHLELTEGLVIAIMGCLLPSCICPQFLLAETFRWCLGGV
jgi:hypothetical protein